MRSHTLKKQGRCLSILVGLSGTRPPDLYVAGATWHHVGYIKGTWIPYKARAGTFPMGFWLLACPRGEGNPCKHRDVQLACIYQQRYDWSLLGPREPDAVRILTGWVCIDEQTGEGLHTQMDCNSDGHCTFPLRTKGKKQLDFISFFSPGHSSTSRYPLVFMWEVQLALGLTILWI